MLKYIAVSTYGYNNIGVGTTVKACGAVNINFEAMKQEAKRSLAFG